MVHWSSLSYPLPNQRPFNTLDVLPVVMFFTRTYLIDHRKLLERTQEPLGYAAYSKSVKHLPDT